MFKALIFDMDGLMIDTEPLYWDVARRMAGRYGTSVTDDTLRSMMGRGRHDSMAIFAGACGIKAPVDDLLAMREQMMIERFRAGVEPMAGVVDSVQRFHGRLKLAIATSSPRKFVEVLLPALGLERYFDVVQTSDDIAHSKPHPEIYHRTMQRLDIEPAHAIVLEDSHAGALAGKRSGAYTIAVPSPLTAQQDFSFAHHRAADLSDAAAHIELLLARQAPADR